MRCLVILVILSVALTSWARYTGSNLDYGYDYGYAGLGLSSTIHFKPAYTTSKPVYVNSWKPIYGYKPYTGHGSAYGYGYRPTNKPYYSYRPYYGYKPYYGYGSSYLHGNNPYYYGSYDLGLGYGHGYTDW